MVIADGQEENFISGLIDRVLANQFSWPLSYQ